MSKEVNVETWDDIPDWLLISNGGAAAHSSSEGSECRSRYIDRIAPEGMRPATIVEKEKGIAEGRLLTAIHRGAVPAKHVKTFWFVREADVEKWLRETA